MIDLKKFAGVRYRMVLDESAELDTDHESRLWYYRIPCKYGFIAVHGPKTLSASTNRRIMAGRLATLPGVKVRQRGDSEVTVTFPPDCLDAVANLLQAKRRRRLSDAHKASLAASNAEFRFQPRLSGSETVAS